MARNLYLFIMLFAGLATTLWGQEQSAAKDATSIYLIGNSLTWDTVPPRLNGDVQWHVDCGKSLKFIRENPKQPCVKTSTLWPDALKNKKYDIVSVQPHYGTTLEEEIATISNWIEMQPQAIFIIHTGWAHSKTLTEEYFSAALPVRMTHSPAYFRILIQQLQKKFPKTEFRTTHAMRLLIELKQGIDAESVPLENVEGVYRDAIHMTTTAGRYLMHNAMRETIGQTRTQEGFAPIPDDLRVILDNLLDQRKTWAQAVPPTRAPLQ